MQWRNEGWLLRKSAVSTNILELECIFSEVTAEAVEKMNEKSSYRDMRRANGESWEEP